MIYRILDKEQGYIKRVRIYHLNALRCEHRNNTNEEIEERFNDLVKVEDQFTQGTFVNDPI